MQAHRNHLRTLVLVLITAFMSTGCSGLLSRQAGFGSLIGSGIGAAAGVTIAKDSSSRSSVAALTGGLGAAVGYFSGARAYESKTQRQQAAAPALRKPDFGAAFSARRTQIEHWHAAIKSENRWHGEYPCRKSEPFAYMIEASEIVRCN